jgi:dTDP-glucose pyrophosphorylase
MKKNTISPAATLVDAVRTIEQSTKRLAVVTDQDNRVIGTLTDGDIRRSVLNGNDLNTLVTEAMNRQPAIALVDEPDSVLQEILKKYNIRSIPLIDHHNRYVRTLYETELYKTDSPLAIEKSFTAAVIMAGGEGNRLRPLTKKLPKPMIDINGIPLLERQIRGLEKMGIKSIYISINYLGSIIKDHFGAGDEFGVTINYLHEDKKLGTAGALSLLPSMNKKNDLLVMNGDILTKSDFIHLYHFHKEHNASITVSAIGYHINIPYGVIECRGATVTGLQEKPSQRFFCNAGIYALSVEMLQKVPKETFWNMTDLIEKCLADKENVSVFPVHEYWTDIGTPGDLEKARNHHKI